MVYHYFNAKPHFHVHMNCNTVAKPSRLKRKCIEMHSYIFDLNIDVFRCFLMLSCQKTSMFLYQADFSLSLCLNAFLTNDSDQSGKTLSRPSRQTIQVYTQERQKNFLPVDDLSTISGYRVQVVPVPVIRMCDQIE